MIFTFFCLKLAWFRCVDMVITELGVFELQDGGMVLTEIGVFSEFKASIVGNSLN